MDLAEHGGEVTSTSVEGGRLDVRGKHQFGVVKGDAASHVVLKPDLINLESLQLMDLAEHGGEVTSTSVEGGRLDVRGKHQFGVVKGDAASHVVLKPDLIELYELEDLAEHGGEVTSTSVEGGRLDVRGKHQFGVVKGDAASHVVLKPDLINLGSEF